eukprot:XP_019858196.1 PREDICTED: uncharacterized protein LOC109586448 [Amphimedon queenslandica]
MRSGSRSHPNPRWINAMALDDFLLRALIGGLGVAIAAGPIGCFVVWRRMAYFGAALAHAVLLGVAFGFLLQIDPTLGALVICLLLAAALTLLERRRLLPVDALIGVLAHAVFAAGYIAISFMERVRVDLIGYLFGDILAIGVMDLVFVFATAALALSVLAWQWRNLLAITINEDLAAVEGVPVGRTRVVLVLLLAAVIAVGMKIAECYPVKERSSRFHTATPRVFSHPRTSVV